MALSGDYFFRGVSCHIFSPASGLPFFLVSASQTHTLSTALQNSRFSCADSSSSCTFPFCFVTLRIPFSPAGAAFFSWRFAPSDFSQCATRPFYSPEQNAPCSPGISFLSRSGIKVLELRKNGARGRECVEATINYKFLEQFREMRRIGTEVGEMRRRSLKYSFLEHFGKMRRRGTKVGEMRRRDSKLYFLEK